VNILNRFNFHWYLPFVFRTAVATAFAVSIAPTRVCPGAEPSPEYVMKLAAIAPEGTSWAEIGHRVKMEIEERTGGRMKVIWYLGAVMGDEPDEIRKIKLGQLQGAGFTIMGMGLIDSAFKILELPFLLENYEEVSHVLDKMRPTFNRMFEEKGFLLAGFVDVGFVYIFTDRPITSINDLATFKMWTWSGEPVAEIFIRRAGFTNIIPTTLPETLTALQTGMVNAFYVTLYAAVGLQWYTQARYISNFTFGYTPAAILLDAKFMKKLPPEFQRITREAFDRHLPELFEIARKDNEKAHRMFLKSGIQAYPTPPGVIEELRKRIHPLRSELAGKYYPEELLVELQNTLHTFRSGKTQGRVQ